MAPVYSHASEDPFLWLEDVDGEKALNWVKAQNASTADRLKSQPIFEELHQQALSALNNDSRIPSVTQRGDMLYNYWRDKDHPRGIYRRTTLGSFMTDSPEWETVLDLDKMSEEAGKPIAFKGMSCLEPENRLCLVRLSPGGGDAVEIREFDSKSKSFVEDGFSFPVAKSQAQWIDADTLYIGTDFGPDSFTDSGYPRIGKKNYPRPIP